MVLSFGLCIFSEDIYGLAVDHYIFKCEILPLFGELHARLFWFFLLHFVLRLSRRILFLILVLLWLGGAVFFKEGDQIPQSFSELIIAGVTSEILNVVVQVFHTVQPMLFSGF